MKNLLLLGDSIRMGYDSFVQEKLAGRMNVFFAEDNGRFVQYTLRALSDWKGKLSLPEIDVVHWNNGLWDVLHLNANSRGCDGETEGIGKKIIDEWPYAFMEYNGIVDTYTGATFAGITRAAVVEAMRQALADGSLSPERWETYRRLEEESNWSKRLKNERNMKISMQKRKMSRQKT